MHVVCVRTSRKTRACACVLFCNTPPPSGAERARDGCCSGDSLRAAAGLLLLLLLLLRMQSVRVRARARVLLRARVRVRACACTHVLCARACGCCAAAAAALLLPGCCSTRRRWRVTASTLAASAVRACVRVRARVCGTAERRGACARGANLSSFKPGSPSTHRTQMSRLHGHISPSRRPSPRPSPRPRPRLPRLLRRPARRSSLRRLGARACCPLGQTRQKIRRRVCAKRRSA